MYTPQLEPLPFLNLPESRLNYPLMRFLSFLFPLYAKILKFNKAELLHPQRIVQSYKKFIDKKSRLILGFRHAYGDDPQLNVLLFHYAMPKAAKKLKIKLPSFTHVHFVYGVEVPMWSDSFVRALLPQVGAVPINHLSMDAKGLTRIRKLVQDGNFPIALAPEGHVTYGSERVLDLELGTARFGFWCMEDLEKAERSEDTYILPISSHYRYGKKAPKQLMVILSEMEKFFTLSQEKNQVKNSKVDLCSVPTRLRAIGQSILDELARYYEKKGCLPNEARPETKPRASSGELQQRVLEGALSAAEQSLGIQKDLKADAMTRLYVIRNKGWSLLFRSDLDKLSHIQKELACRSAGEAWFAMRDMEVSELLIYVDFLAVPDQAPLETYIEITNNFYDTIGRMQGGTLKNKPDRFQKYPVIIPGEPIRINDYREQYKNDKKKGLQAVTNELRVRYEQCIKEYQDVYR